MEQARKSRTKYTSKVEVSFNTAGEANGEAIVNDGAKRPKCSRCGRNSHTVDKCTAKYRDDGTMLHSMGEVKEADYEINNEVSAGMTTNEVSTEMTTKHEDPRCHGDALIFIQPDVNSLMGWSNTSSKTVGIPKT